MRKVLIVLVIIVSYNCNAQTYKLSYTFKTYKFHTDSFTPKSLTKETIETYQNEDYIPDSKIETINCSLVSATDTYFCVALRVIKQIETEIGSTNFCEAVTFAKNEMRRRNVFIKTKIQIRNDEITRPLTGAMSIYLNNPKDPYCSILSKTFKGLIDSKEPSFFKNKRYTKKECKCVNTEAEKEDLALWIKDQPKINTKKEKVVDWIYSLDRKIFHHKKNQTDGMYYNLQADSLELFAKHLNKPLLIVNVGGLKYKKGSLNLDEQNIKFLENKIVAGVDYGYTRAFSKWVKEKQLTLKTIPALIYINAEGEIIVAQSSTFEYLQTNLSNWLKDIEEKESNENKTIKQKATEQDSIKKQTNYW